MTSEPSAAASKPSTWLVGLALVLITALVFHRVVFFEFLTWDDDQHIVDNVHFQPLTLESFTYFWKYAFIYLYIPVSYNFFAAEAWLSQIFPAADSDDVFNPAIFHLGNLLLHLGNVLLVYRLLLRLTRHVPGSFLGALLFAIHPLQVESVAWLSETRGTLATLFSLLAIHRYFNFAGIDPERGLFADQAYEPPQRRKLDYVLATLYFALALLSKPSASSLPVIVAIVDMALLRRRWQDSLRWLALWFVMAAAIMVVTKYHQRTGLIYARSVRELSDRPYIAGDAYAWYLCKLVWPFDLAFDHGRTPFYAMETPTYLYAWALPVGVGLLLACSKRRRIWLGCYAIFLAALAPVSGLITFLFQSISTVADRYVYVPIIGLALLLAAWTATRRNPLWITIAAMLLLGFAAHRSYEQTETWRDDWTMFGQGLKVTPKSFMAHLHLGNRLRNDGRYEAAVGHYRAMLSIRPDFYTTHFLIGVCLYELQRYEEAVLEFGIASSVSRQYLDAWCMLGKSLVELEKWDEADVAYKRAREEIPDAVEPYLLQAESYAQREQYGDAELWFRDAIAKDEGSADAHLRYGRMLVEVDRLPEAVREFERAASLAPDDFTPHYEAAAALYRQGKYAPAIAAAERALALEPNDFGTLQTLGLACAAGGRTAAAIAPLEQALTLVPPGSPQAVAVRKTLNELKRR